MNACTIIARNYLPHARVLAGSFLEQHPGGTFTVLVIDDDGDGDWSQEPFAVLSPYDIGVEQAEVNRMAFIYDVKEFATAVKPFLLRHLLEGADHVVYFDPDIEIFAPLDDIAALARQHGIVLTPHTTESLPRDQLLPSEEMLLRAGIYNLGFIAVGRGAQPFLDWWAERLARDCLVDVEQGIFVDQRWIDFVPALYDHVVLKDPTCNVAYWNLSNRTLAWTGEGYEVNGAPLRFYHYSGYSADQFELLSAHMGDIPRIVLGDVPDVCKLCEEYAEKLREQGFGQEDGAWRYRFDELPNGLAITDEVRRDVRLAILAAERAGETAPDPFDPGSVEAFLDWLAEPIGPASIPRHLDALYQRRGDLRHAFPEVGRGSGRRFLAWAWETRRDRPGIPRVALTRALGDSAPTVRTGRTGRAAELEDWLRDTAERYRWLQPFAGAYGRVRRALWRSRKRPGGEALVTVPSKPPLPGVNVAGYLRAELGVGEAARRLIAGLEAGGIPHAPITYRRTASRQEHPFTASHAFALYDTNVVCVNADELPNFHLEARALFRGRYTIGLWFWEVSRFPESLHRAFELVDEIWVASEFVRDAIAAATDKPVHIVPLPVETPRQTRFTRSELGLPDDFLFLFSFDFLSVTERKNPLGLIDAFTRAFAPGEGPRLVIKTINGDQDPDELARLRRHAAARPDITVVDGYVSAAERDAYMALCDCYVSLHRSEGYGLTMAEAMAAAKPVIATGYSGNMVFMDEGNSFLVSYRVTTVPAGCPPYPAGAEWAEPDIGVAARLMRGVWEDPDEARAVGRRAQEDILRRNSPAQTARFVARRLDAVQSERGARWQADAHEIVPGTALFDSGRRRPTRAARRMLHRLLWPYLVEQQAFDAAVADALRAYGSFEAALPAIAELEQHRPRTRPELVELPETQTASAEAVERVRSTAR